MYMYLYIQLKCLTYILYIYLNCCVVKLFCDIKQIFVTKILWSSTYRYMVHQESHEIFIIVITCNSYYSRTGVLRPPLLPGKSGRKWQVGVNGSYGCDVMVAIKSALLNNKIFLKERKPAKVGKTFKIFCAELKEQQLLDTPKTLINYMYLYI